MMKWDNLKVNKCPQCNKSIASAKYDPVKKMIMCKCGFKITENKMAEIVSSKVNKELEENEDNI